MNHIDPNLAEEIYQNIVNDLLNNYYIKSVNQIAKIFKKDSRIIIKHLKYLEKINKVINIRNEEIKNFPYLYIPKEILDESNLDILKPSWIKKYEFYEKKQLLDELNKIKKHLNLYYNFENLLCSTGKKLEDAVYESLKFLEFQNLQKNNSENYDISFNYGPIKCILEITGSLKPIKKDKVNQLDGWIKKEINYGISASNLQGFLIVNAQFNIDPSERTSYLTGTAKEYLKYHHFKFLTTEYIFNLIKDVNEKRTSKKDAQACIFKGLNYDDY
ncbi:MAG: hypothetical protein ACTSVV_11665 [Promethearchaeota archaeon]